MHILIVNDDGIGSPGIVMLAEAAKAFGDVTVVAPDGQRSGMSQHISVHGDMIVSRAVDFPLEDVEAYQINGTPADCVRVGLWAVMKEKPDLVLSGVNTGFNVGFDTAYSGTVGAAKEAVFLGVPAIAFSSGGDTYLPDVEDYLEPIIRDLLARPIDPWAFWNVNFPKCHKDEIRGIKEDCFPAHAVYYQTSYEPKGKEDDGMHYQIRICFPQAQEECSDIQALLDGYISIGRIGNLRPSVR